MRFYFVWNSVGFMFLISLVPLIDALKPQVTFSGSSLYLKSGQQLSETCLLLNTDWIIKVVNIYFGSVNFRIDLTSCNATKGDEGTTYNCSLAMSTDEIIKKITDKRGVARCEALGFASEAQSIPVLANSELKPYTVLYPPASVSIDTPLYEKLGDVLEVICTASETTWLSPKMFLLVADMSYSKELTCTTVDGVDSGKIFTCTAKINDFGSIFNQKLAFCEFQTTIELKETKKSENAVITIMYPPTIVTIETLLYSVEGEPINVTCKTTETTWSNPKMLLTISEISYSKDLSCSSINGTQGGKIYTCSGQLNEIRPIYANKSALCVFQSNVETKSSSINPLNITYRPSNVSIRTPLNVVEGQPFNVTCAASETTWTNPIMTFSIPDLSYSKQLNCSSSNGAVNGTMTYSCFNTISDLDRKFNKKSAFCVLLATQGTKISTSNELSVSFAPNTVSIVSDSIIMMLEASPYTATCSVSESTWTKPIVTFEVANITLQLTSCINTDGVNRGIVYTCSSILDSALITASLNNEVASCSATNNTKYILYATEKLVQVMYKTSFDNFKTLILILGIVGGAVLLAVLLVVGLVAYFMKKRKGFFMLS